MRRRTNPEQGLGGYIYASDEPGHGELLVDGRSFTAVISRERGAPSTLPAFLTLTGERVDAVARMTPAGRPASLKARVRLDEAKLLQCELTWTAVIAELSPATRAVIERVVAERGGPVPATAFAELTATLRRLCPESGGDIDLVLTLSHERANLPRPVGDGEPITMFEGDAVALALGMAGFDRRDELAFWQGDADAPFLAGVAAYQLLEDRMIDNDAKVFGDWNLVEGSAVGWAEFQRDGDHLWTINVNRSPVEHSLGVDLIYYTHTYGAYVLVQYKRMEREAGSDAVYRPNDQFETELARMRALVLDENAPAAPNEYRLDPRCCYLKLCPSVAREVPVGSLVGGMYLPLAYWDVLAASPQVVGPRGGVAVTHESAGRYLDNTQFVSLVQDGWVGSRGVTSQQITEVIRSGLDAHRSIILAAAKRGAEGATRRNRRRR